MIFGEYSSTGNFNPRSYKRSDEWETEHNVIDHISIHAPTRGATYNALMDLEDNIDFNPRSYKRSDLVVRQRTQRRYRFQSTLLQEERHRMIAEVYYGQQFQSTLLQEERRIVYSSQKRLYYFNPRSYKRSD